MKKTFLYYLFFKKLLTKNNLGLLLSKIANADYISSRHGGVLGKVFN